MQAQLELEQKFAGSDTGLQLEGDDVIQGYASLFGEIDQGGDVVMPGAYGASLSALAARDCKVKMLWQHDPGQPIVVWDEVREDARGLWVKGRVLTETQRGAEAVSLIAAGALDGLSIGYRTVQAAHHEGGGRKLTELDLWEVSLVTFPMLATARVAAKSTSETEAVLRALAAELRGARDT
ncbi:HK97 family phage prohead protease [Phycobacter azelaicus]|uniref:HK97 family phage prohead protease n=1 Tax=Phycobacter azelaicus TaxID=2668075 RepID=UPI001867D4AA|nr:HK97 family phage prohead protease [Phycobacter azelaicus]MBE1295308.1 HK97 family phage prohead protease [Paracoccaceae bacterium]